MARIARDLASSLHQSTFNEPLPAQNRNMNSITQPFRFGKMLQVAIVGAGMSGLRCADVLTRAGAHVTIFEARNRIGGRVHQEENGGYLVDAGSNWIHGTEGNPIMDISERTKTIIMDPDDEAAIFDINGNQKSPEEAGILSEILWAEIGEATDYSDRNSDSIDAKVSLFDWLKQRFEQKYGDNPEEVSELSELSRLYGQFVGNPVTRQSLKFFWLEEGLPGGNVFVGSTYRKILEAVAKPAIARADIKLNTEVTQVSYRAPADRETTAKVTLADGSQHGFDEIVVTCPLGWLKRNASSTFTPTLPPRLTEAIDNIGYGALEKVYVSFPSAFWLNDGKTSSYPWNIDFMNPKYHPDPAAKESETWNMGIVSLAHLPEPANQPTLLFYMHGDCGAYLTHKLSSHERHSKEYNTLLKEFSEPYYSRLPNFDASSPSCQPTSFYITTWQLDPYAGHGGYSCFPVGLEEGDKDIECMRDAGGLSDAGRGLWLAGEHTAPFVAMGTTTGAYWSGEGVARRIAQQYGLAVPHDASDSFGAHANVLADKIEAGAANGHT